MKNIIIPIIAIAIIIMNVFCACSKTEPAEKELDLLNTYLPILEHMNVLWIDDGSEITKTPSFTDSTVLENIHWDIENTLWDQNIPVEARLWNFSFDNMRWNIYVYELANKKSLNITDREIFEILYGKNEDKIKELDKLCEWFEYEYGFETKRIFTYGISQALSLYKNQFGKDFNDKAEYTAEEKRAIIEWVIDNPDHEYAGEHDDYKNLLIVLGLAE